MRQLLQSNGFVILRISKRARPLLPWRRRCPRGLPQFAVGFPITTTFDNVPSWLWAQPQSLRPKEGWRSNCFFWTLGPPGLLKKLVRIFQLTLLSHVGTGHIGAA